MPPRSSAKDVIISLGSDQELVVADHVMAAATMSMDHLHLTTTTTRSGGGGGGGGGTLRGSQKVMPRPASDLTFYVGRTRVAYTLSADTLRHSTYFASLLEKQKQRVPDPVVLDCDEATFQNMILILRYGSFQALPKMSESSLFRLKRELECYGIDVPESHQKPSSPVSSSTSSPQRISSQRPQSLQMVAAKAVQQHYHHHRGGGGGGVESTFPDLPEELKDPAKLFLVARMDDIEKGIRCECCTMLGGKDQVHTYWALSFHYRHTFCTGCGRSCPASFPPRHLAEMYMGAAMYYSNESFANKHKWSVGCDSTCSLKLLSAKPNCICPCSVRSEISSSSFSCDDSLRSPSAPPSWAVSTYYSHAFCTRCGQAADERTLIYILLSHRYGGVSKHHHHQSKLARSRDHVDGVIAQDSARVFAINSPGPEIRHQRGNRSM